jgi:hypothetical protein
MAGVGDLVKKVFGPNSVTRQFFVWGFAQQLVQSVLGPMFQAITNQANTSNPNLPASPAELADMVVRDIAGHDWASREARKSGISKEIFDLMVQNTGVPPSLIDMLQLFRRGKVNRDTVIRAIKQSRVKNEWIDTILQLGVQYPSPTDILRAYLQGQVDGDRAHELYTQLGGAPEFFQLLYDTEGAAPTPNEAAQMARKGIIPWTGTGPGVVSYQQAFLEGPWRNKWLKAFQEDAEYLPPPRTITAMVREGTLTIPEATALLIKQGVPDSLIANYLTDASAAKVIKAKELTESTISSLYQEHAIDDAKAKELLGKLKYTPAETDFVLTAWKLAREMKFRNTAISTVHTQYVNHRIEAGPAAIALDKFGVPATQRQALIALWTEEAKTKVTLLTPAQVKAALRQEIIDYDAALSRLVNLGYSEDDANIFLLI